MAMAPMKVDMRSRTRERDAAEEDDTTATAAVKRRKLEEEVEGESRIVSSPVKLADGGGIVTRDSEEPPETSVDGRNSPAGEQCQSPNSEDNLRRASISCCSSIGFSEKLNVSFDFQDLEPYNVAETEMGTTRHYSISTSEPESMDSAAEGEEEVKESEEAAESCGSSSVTEAELEAFFMAEKDLRYKILEYYSSKYNFDFVKEEALDGRYEWVKLKP